MRKVLINCPVCKKTSIFFLASEPCIMILNCPECHKTLLNNDDITYLLTNTLERPGNKKLEGFIEQEKKQPQNPNRSKLVKHNSSKLSKGKNYPRHKMGEPLQTLSVSKDDILNLKISLESCNDIEDFIKLM